MVGGWGLLGTRAPLVRCVQRVVGKYRHAALPLRHPLAALESLFYSQEERRRGPQRWRDDRWEELMSVTLLVPLLSVDLSARFDDILTSTDASGGDKWFGALGVSEARVDVDQIHQLCCHCCFRGDYTSLKSETPGLFCWDAESPTRMTAIRVDTKSVRWRHVMSIPRKEKGHINPVE